MTVPPERAMGIGLHCIGMELCLGTPVLFALVWLARRGVAADPLLAAVVGAFGVALVADAVWRLVCPFSSSGHVATSHGPGMVGVVLIGVGLAVAKTRRQAARPTRA